MFPRTDPSQPALEPVFATGGGPGFSVTQGTGDFWTMFFGPLLERRDLVLIDQRGVGLSDLITCEPLQSGAPDVFDAVAQCAAQLGDASDLYGSAAVAEDIDAVRAALGAERIDFYGSSYAGVDAAAYAVRHPDRLRAVVLDSPVAATRVDPWFTSDAGAAVRTLVRACGRSPSCRADHRRPGAELRDLIARVRARPLVGTGFDPFGQRVEVRLDEPLLISMLFSDNGGFTTQGELLAAARAQRQGDPVPLLRLAAESAPGDGGSGDPLVFSAGHAAARGCMDGTFVWDRSAPRAQREAQFAAARAALAPDRFAPFSVAAWTAPPPAGHFPDPCIAWPAPKHDPEPAVPDGARVPQVPALILRGELDLNSAPRFFAGVRAMFPRNRVVELASSGHHTALNARSACSWSLIQDFLEDLALDDARCARADVFHFPGVGRFPRVAAAARPAAVAGRAEDDSTPSDRRVATVVAATITDASRRLFMVGPIDGGRALRGGVVTGDFDDTGAFVDLGLARFTEDVAVTGRPRYDFESQSIEANVALSGDGLTGQVQVSGRWFTDEATVLMVDGQIGGRRVVLRVPSG